MEIITWNVNSVRARLPRVAALLARRQPDLVCLQEIKVSPQDFPAAEFAALGYASAVHGQEGRNGVAMLARAAPADVVRGFDADPAPGQPGCCRPPWPACGSYLCTSSTARPWARPTIRLSCAG